MSDDVLCVKFSPDHKLIAASLLDSTIKVFFADTLKVISGVESVEILFVIVIVCIFVWCI